MSNTRITPTQDVRVTPGGDTRIFFLAGGGVMPDPISDQIVYWALSESEANDFPAGSMVAVLETSYDFIIAGHSPTSWWKLEESSGTTLVDQTTFKDLTLNGSFTLSSSSGVEVGNGVDFTGGYATTTVGAGEYTPNAMTVIAWVNMDSVSVDFASIISRTNTGGSTSEMAWGLAFDDVGGVFFKVKDTTSTVGTDAFLATWASPPINELVMIIGEWQINGPTRIYSNGNNLQGTSSDTDIGLVVDDTTELLLGGAPGDASRRFDGVIYDVVVIPKLLTGEEKDALYAQGSTA